MQETAQKIFRKAVFYKQVLKISIALWNMYATHRNYDILSKSLVPIVPPLRSFLKRLITEGRRASLFRSSPPTLDRYNYNEQNQRTVHHQLPTSLKLILLKFHGHGHFSV
jgi:hypothetical protein